MAKITEDYVSFETAKLLKEKGFKEMCDSLYGLAYMHNGKYIDEDEEYELESEGRGSEIELVEGGMVYNLWHTNNKDSKHEYSRPTLQRAMKWLRKEHSLHIITLPYAPIDRPPYHPGEADIVYFAQIFKGVIPIDEVGRNITKLLPEEACDAAIKYCLENLVK